MVRATLLHFAFLGLFGPPPPPGRSSFFINDTFWFFFYPSYTLVPRSFGVFFFNCLVVGFGTLWIKGIFVLWWSNDESLRGLCLGGDKGQCYTHGLMTRPSYMSTWGVTPPSRWSIWEKSIQLYGIKGQYFYLDASCPVEVWGVP